ncbi:MmgE/PrpD family protein [Chloroflexota bacterium]
MQTIKSKRVDIKLAKFAVETRYSDIPEDMVVFMKHVTLKGIANIVAGGSLPASRKLGALMRDRRSPGDVGVIGYGFRTSLWDAVFLHGFFAHAAELEDDAFSDADGGFSGPSWTITTIPLLLSLSEKLRLSGNDFILALAVGLEVHRRTCLSTIWHRGLMLGPGAIGPAVAASKALGLNLDQTRSAMGLAQSAPFVQFTNYGTDGHFVESALQSLQGIMAAEMAKQGLTGNPDLIGYLSPLLGEEMVNAKAMVAGLGRRWLARDFWLKKYPCSFGAHCSIDILLELRKQHDLSYEEVETIETSARLDKPEPKNAEEAQVSIQHILGAAMRDGDFNLSHFTDVAFADPAYKQARSKVRIVLDANRAGLLSGQPDRVVIRMKDGREFAGERAYPIGSYKDRLTEDQVRDLYRKFTAGVLTAKHIEKTAEMVLNLEKLNDTEELMDILTFRHRTATS